MHITARKAPSHPELYLNNILDLTSEFRNPGLVTGQRECLGTLILIKDQQDPRCFKKNL